MGELATGGAVWRASKIRKTRTGSLKAVRVFPVPAERVSLGDSPPPEPTAGAGRP